MFYFRVDFYLLSLCAKLERLGDSHWCASQSSGHVNVKQGRVCRQGVRMPLNVRSFSDMARESGDGDEGGAAMGGFDPTDTSEGAARSFSEYAYRKRTNPPKTVDGIDASQNFVYHEVQSAALCGQHALNNLLQARVFSEMDLGEVAQGLDAQERSLGLGATMPGQSSNVDSTGNFSIQVLRAALLNSHQVELVTWSNEVKGMNPLQEDGFIINRREHWFALRCIGGRWWNLNSTLERPEPIGDSSLVTFINQLRADGFMVFIPTRGMMPRVGRLPPGYDEKYDGRYWFKESELLAPPPMIGSSGANKPAVAAFSGKGHRLVAKEPEPVVANNLFAAENGEMDDDPELAAAIAASLGGGGPPPSSSGDAFEADLARAIALSTQDSQSGGGEAAAVDTNSGKSEKEIAREKRLAALAARGL